MQQQNLSSPLTADPLPPSSNSSSFSDVENQDGPLFTPNEMRILSDGTIPTSPSGAGSYLSKISQPVQYLISIILGILFGVLLNYLNVNDDTVSLITLPGALFLRALQCTVIPMMFFNIIASVYDIFGSGNASSIGKRAIWFYTLTTVLATIEGIVIANVFSSLLVSEDNDDDDDGVKISLVCPEEEGMMTVTADGTILCIPHDELKLYNISDKYQNFYLRDKEDELVNGIVIKQSLMDQIIGTAYSLVPNNFVQAFAGPNIISVIVIGAVLGTALIRLEKNPRVVGACKLFLGVSKELCDLTNEIISWIIDIAPFCIGFLVAASLATAGNVINLLQTVGVYVLSVTTGIILHVLLVLPLVFYWYTDGMNPYQWLHAIRQPMIVAFSTASSAATLPISIKTAVDSGLIEESTANTLLPLGATINMDGTAIGFPCAINFMAHSVHLEDKLDIATWINVGLASSLGSAGAAPVPNAGIVMLITVWETALPGYSVPDAIAYVQGIEFLLDRFRTATNVCSDLMILRIIQVMVDKEKKLQ